MLPSVKTIMRTGCDKDVAKKIRLLFEGKLNPCDVSESCNRWVNKCYHTPKMVEQVLHAIDDLLDNHGVECITRDNDTQILLYEYSNTGDAYSTTIVRDYRNSRWLVATWGDLVEKMN